MFHKSKEFGFECQVKKNEVFIKQIIHSINPFKIHQMLNWQNLNNKQLKSIISFEARQSYCRIFLEKLFRRKLNALQSLYSLSSLFRYHTRPCKPPIIVNLLFFLLLTQYFICKKVGNWNIFIKTIYSILSKVYSKINNKYKIIIHRIKWKLFR